MKKITLLTVSIFVTTVFSSCTMLALHTPRNTTVLYVSTNGNDAWTGKYPTPGDDDGPLASLAGARDAVRTLKESGQYTQPILVYLRGGTYYQKEPVEFGPRDSGTSAWPITYAAYPGEKPVLSGGRIINREWKQKDGMVSAQLSEVKEGKWFFYQLFVNNKRRTRARTPNEGFYNMVGQISLEGPGQFTFRQGDLKEAWAGRGDVDLIGLSKWSDIRMPIVKVDEKNHTATLSKQVPNSSWRNSKNPRYWIENAPEALDQPGEWRLDKHTGELQMLLHPAEKISYLHVVAPKLEHLIRLKGDIANNRFVKNIHFQGLAFKHSQSPHLQEGYPDRQASFDISAAFTAEGAQHCRIQQCEFAQLGNYAIEFAEGCSYNTIQGNDIGDIGAGGVKIGGPGLRTDQFHAHHNTVSDNHIHHIGRMYPAAVGIWVGQSSYNTLAHNHIHHTFYTGLSVGWTWGYRQTGAHHNIIEYNHVHDIGQGILSDMGGIYTLGTQPGTVIRNNLFHDIYSFSYGGWGIYPDEGSTRIVVENNITYRTKSAGFHQHYGKENIIRNNIFAFAKEYQVMRTRAENHLSFTFERNIVIFDSGKLLGSNWKGNNYKMDYNVYWDLRGQEIAFSTYSLEEWHNKGQDTHSLIADPLFVDARQYDFRLRPDSPALSLGFKPIDLSTVGPRKEFRTK